MDRLIETLNEATSFNPEQRAQAMKMLDKWEVEPNYHLSLQQIYMDKNVSQKTRSLAIISLKNGINKYWRKSAKGAISTQEKQSIKALLLSYLSEPIPLLANTQAVVTSRISRFDFPNEWPDLLDTLIPIVQKAFQEGKPEESALRFNSLYTLHLSMKALCTKTLPSARKMTQTIAPNVFKYLSSLLYSQITIFVDNMHNVNSPFMVEAISLSRLSLKCLRRLLINGYQRFSEKEECAQILAFLTQVFPKVLSIRPNLKSSDLKLLKLADGFVKLIGKILVDCTQDRVLDLILTPSSIILVKQFNELLVNPSSVTLVVDGDLLLESLQIQAIKAMKNLVSHREYHTIGPHRDERAGQALKILQSALYTPEFVLSTTQLLISRYTILNDAALQEWQDDPESFFQEEESDVWEYNLRRCAEKLLMVLVSTSKELICPFLSESLKSLPSSDNSIESLKFRESLFGAIGHGAHCIADYVNFGSWLESLAVECNRSDREWNIIKRRVAILISQWVAVTTFDHQHPLLYRILLSMLAPNNDLVVRLTAVNALKAVADDFGFSTVTFEPYLQQSIDCFMQLLENVDEFESKLTVINCLVVLVERMDGQVLPSIAPLINILPSLWDRSGGQNLFRSSIVQVITKLVSTLRSESYQLYPIVIPILQESVDIAKPEHLYLLEQGLDLWIATIQNSNNVSADLVSLVPFAIKLLELGTENLKKVLHILECNILLAPLEILNHYSDPLFSELGQLLGTLTASASNSLLRLIDITVQACHKANCFHALIQVMYAKGIFTKLLTTIYGGAELSVIIVGFLMIMSRMAIYDAKTLLQIMQTEGGDAAIPRFLDAFLEKYDYFGQAKQRKLCALAFASLIGTGNSFVIQRFSAICAVLTSVYASDLDKNEMVLFTFEPRDGDDDEGSMDFTRRSTLKNQDILFQAHSLGPYLKQKIIECELVLNQSGLVDSIQDPEIRSQIQRMILWRIE